MKTEKFSKTTSLLLIATLALAMAGTGQRCWTIERKNGPASPPSTLKVLLKLALSHVLPLLRRLHLHGCRLCLLHGRAQLVAPQYRTTMTISALIVGIAAFHYYYMRGVYS